jgi:hypothetical protein
MAFRHVAPGPLYANKAAGGWLGIRANHLASENVPPRDPRAQKKKKRKRKSWVPQTSSSPTQKMQKP